MTVRRESAQWTFVGEADFIADKGGRVDTGVMKPHNAAYSGVDASGLFWAVESRPAQPGDPSPGKVCVTAEVDGAGKVSAIAHTTPDAAGIIQSKDTPFAGAVWARPRRPGRHPVIIVLGGSEGGSGTAETYAPLFAARGYATLGLPYYNPNHDARLNALPGSFTEIPVDRLNTVHEWLAAQPDADTTRIGLWGISKGAEFVLIAASYEPWVKAVVAIAPSDVIWEGWGRPGPPTSSFAMNGRALPFQPYGDYQSELEKRRRGGGDLDYLRIHTAGRTEYPEKLAAARIPIERFKGKLLLVAGEGDTIWPSATMTRNIAQRRKAAEETTRVLIFPNAEHALGGPGTVPLEQVGSVKYATIHARKVAWAATFEMLGKALMH